MADDKKDILFPVGRLVGGSITQGQDKDYEGRPLVYKTGANIGKPRLDFSFGVAIPKGEEQSWAQTPWGQAIYQTGCAAFPNGAANSPSFSWKIQNGDDTTPNKKGNKPCDREGFPGHWVVWFSGSAPPKTCDAKGSAFIDPEMIKPGYFVQVWGSTNGNNSAGNPGVYLNHNIVSLQGYGPEISLGLDPSQVGFGQQALPAGASAAPVGMEANGGGTAVAGLPGALPGMQTSAATSLPGAQATGPGPLAVQPNGALTAAATGAGAAPPPPAPAPPPAAGPKMTAKAGATPYASFIASGWTDAQLLAEGYMTA